MSVFDLFRRFFLPPGERDLFFGGMTLDEDEDEDEDDDDDLFFRRPPGPGFQSPFWHQGPAFQDPFGFEDVFRDFHALFGDFGAVMHDAPRFLGTEPSGTIPEGSRGGSLRDSMLKYPDSRLPREQTPSCRDPGTPQRPPQHRWPSPWRLDIDSSPPEESKQDKALDSEVSSRGLDAVLRPREPPAASSYFHSVSVSKVIRPDGTVEERRTVRDGRGNTTTAVTVTRGDEVISSRSPDSPRDPTICPQDSAPGLPDLSDSQTILSRILQRWFSSW